MKPTAALLRTPRKEPLSADPPRQRVVPHLALVQRYHGMYIRYSTPDCRLEMTGGGPLSCSHFSFFLSPPYAPPLPSPSLPPPSPL